MTHKSIQKRFSARCLRAALAFGLVFGLFFQKMAAQETGNDKPRFRAGAVLGFTASQIDGDDSYGYNKLGLQAGIKSLIRLGRRTDLSIEFLFSQRGSQSRFTRDPDENFFSLTLNNLEVPILFHYYDWLGVSGDDKEFYRVSFDAGLSFARLIGYSVSDDVAAIRLVPDGGFLEKNDFSICAGVCYYINPKWGASFRYNRSLGYMYQPEKWASPPLVKGWNGHCLYFHTFYLF